jgi:hypothetical protein
MTNFKSPLEFGALRVAREIAEILVTQEREEERLNLCHYSTSLSPLLPSLWSILNPPPPPSSDKSVPL